MKIGTKSVLFGAHCFFLHPWFVAWAWWKLYGFPVDPRLWCAFILHDIGYVGKPNMDGPEGEQHPYVGARIMGALFGAHWFAFTLYHSRFLAKREGQPFSRLCVADKLAIALTPRWLYLPLVNLTGEIAEYMALSGRNNATGSKYASMQLTTDNQRDWHRTMCDYVRRWVVEHQDGKADQWTPAPESR